MSLGDGRYPVDEQPDTVSLPSNIHQVHTTEALMHYIYSNIEDRGCDSAWLLERSILAPLNDTVKYINEKVLSSFPGEESEYKSIDTTSTPEEAVHSPVEFLNSLVIPGIPQHILTLKPGCPIMILRSLDDFLVVKDTLYVSGRSKDSVVSTEH